MSNFKALTAAKLAELESHPFYKKLISGDITKERYALYLWDQAYRYGAIEEWMEGTTVFDGIEAIKRYPSVNADFKELWKDNLGRKHMPQPSWSATDMAKRLKVIKEDDIEDTMQGLAHIYAMHGDLIRLSKKIDVSKLPGSNKMFKFSENADELMAKLESKITPAMAGEINQAYDLKIRMFNYLMNINLEDIIYDNKSDNF